ncbi:MAG: fatty acid desaturase [Actinomycetota bacterium]|nr:fatty acid desaturase [Acidimicrobiales bacterium]MEC7898591.1 fatty acid desaturase [Actinomycetota bacterium]
MQENQSHAEMLVSMTGKMVIPAEEFAGSSRLHPNGKPKGAFRDSLRKIPNFRNFLSVTLGLSFPPLIVWLVVSFSHPLTWIIAIVGMALAQNRLFIFHHEAAHRLLFSNRKFNDFIGIRLIGWLTFGSGSHGYRIGHIKHHRNEFGPEEPDFILYSFYPISKSSMIRKLLRDVSGISALRIIKPRFKQLKKARRLRLTISFLFGQISIAILFWLFCSLTMYLFLWLLPWACVYQLLNRIRAISEHGGMTQSSDRRETTHYVKQSRMAAFFITPFNVGYHLAHHVDMLVPSKNLPILNKALLEDGYITSSRIWPNYRSLWKALVN